MCFKVTIFISLDPPIHFDLIVFLTGYIFEADWSRSISTFYATVHDTKYDGKDIEELLEHLPEPILQMQRNAPTLKVRDDRWDEYVTTKPRLGPLFYAMPRAMGIELATILSDVKLYICRGDRLVS
jgi:hypothetical protein